MNTPTTFTRRAFIGLLAVAVISPPAPADEPKALVLGVWKVNWPKSAPKIQSVPLPLQNRYKSAEEFREFLTPQLTGMTVEMQPAGNMIVRSAPTFEPQYGTWRLGPRDGTHWIDVTSTGAHHGLIPHDANRATLLFEIKVSPGGVIRIPILAERPLEAPAEGK